MKILFALLAAFLMSACQRREAQPEMLDKIYSDLKVTLAEEEKAAEEEKKKIEESEKKFEQYEPNTLELKQVRKANLAAKESYQKHAQMVEFYKIRVEKRRLEDRVTYELAFQKKEAWPDPSEYEGYLQNKKLRNAGLDWKARVPSITDRYSKNPAPVKKTEKKAEAE